MFVSNNIFFHDFGYDIILRTDSPFEYYDCWHIALLNIDANYINTCYYSSKFDLFGRNDVVS